jgi:Domain of unknown function (DUF4276)
VPIRIATIVEGHGEVAAIPVLLHRIAREVVPNAQLVTPTPLRLARGSLLKRDSRELERGVALAAHQAGPNGAVVIFVDSDDDRPCTLGPELLGRAQGMRPDVNIVVALAVREFESWFLAAADSLRGSYGFPPNITRPTDPEAIRDAKGHLKECHSQRRYSETVDQVAIMRLIDLQMARSSRSFDRCFLRIASLMQRIEEAQTP